MMSTSSRFLNTDHISTDITSEVSDLSLPVRDNSLNYLFPKPIQIVQQSAKDVVSESPPLSEIDFCNVPLENVQYDSKVQKRLTISQNENTLHPNDSIPPFNSLAGGNGNSMMDHAPISMFSPSEEGSSHQTPEASIPVIEEGSSLKSAISKSYGDDESESNRRVIHINNPEWTNEKYDFTGNKVRTSKYTMLSFLPRNVFEQFHRIAYIYFLVIVILNQIPQLAVFGRTASLFPLLFVLFVTAIKDGYEDWGRHRSDREENNRLSLVLEDGLFKPKKWKKIQVGEVVKVDANESVPCDMVLLGTSDKSGLAYIQTINLDGESNLKTRYARHETLIKNPEVDPIVGTIVCEPPNRNIYEFTAFMELDGDRIPLGPNNIILRGCELKNTSWVVGVAVYAGRETKAMLNSSRTHSKRSRLEQHMNKETLWLSFFLLVICVIGGGGAAIWVSQNVSQLDALPFFRKTDSEGEEYMFYGTVGALGFGFLSFIIMFQIMIPISLYISLELVRLGQSYFMVRDTHMYDSGSDSRFQCRALNINEDLGQIKYVFSDKTGTLTENKMEFHSASIFGANYFGISLVTDKNFDAVNGSYDTRMAKGSQGWKPTVEARVDPKIVQILQSPSSTHERKVLHEYFLVLAACNTVVPTQVNVSPAGKIEMKVSMAIEGKKGTLEYQGESPDEQALVSAAASYGFVLLERTSSYIVIDVLGKLQRFKLLGVHEFDSVRKRMSVVVKCPDGTVKLLLKGADASVLDILAKRNEPASVFLENDGNIIVEDKQQKEILAATVAHLGLYAGDGLRTLVVASRDLGRTEFDAWSDQYAKASTALVNRIGLLRNAANMVENQLTLLGATGIEDKLQAGVPETIASLRAAGIKVWVLTGDKQETAISIGFSCMLLTKDMHQIVINESSKDLCHKALQSAKIKYSRFSSSIDLEREFIDQPNIPSNSNIITSLALVIDGNSLVHALSPDLEDELFELSTLCEVVLCCRVAPLQKAGIVSLIKKKTNEMTLAIGDGANDVSMIQTAHVGVGISGQEGRQAVMASDFAMGQFRFLKRLLLVHGHWNYQRLAYMVLYNLYRNAVFVMMLFWYILNTAFSPSTAIFDWNLVFYSLIYTSIPTVAVGILDKDVSHRTLMKYPQLYAVGQKSKSYNSFLFWLTMLDTLWQSLVLFFVPFFTYQATTIDIWSMGSLWIAAVVILVNLHLALDVQRWTLVTHLAVWGSLLATYACFFLLDSLPEESFLSHYWVIYHVIGTAYYWLNLLLIIVLGLLPRFCIKVIKQRWWPSDVHIAREADKLDRNYMSKQSSLELNVLHHRESGVGSSL
ncbi:hypothetical protein O6H91_Y232800 [Diphasiastrum complanatum]|nr:hypothetical protein O6H91_Y232800 [Diphasiastrum complanatum]KAJ7294784.1 hypothetical protein O6H91_Y232800 [Diphasiastrum complanatum]